MKKDSGRVSIKAGIVWAGIGVFVVSLFVQISNGATLDEIVQFASVTPYPTAISGASQDNEQVSNNTNSIVLHVAPTAPPLQPTAQPTATPAPTATPYPTATPQATVTAVWGYVVGTSEAMQRRIEALEERPAPQVEQVGFVHYGTAGVTLLIGAIVWVLAHMAGKEDFSTAVLPRSAQERAVVPHSVTVEQHSTTVAPDSDPVARDNWAIARNIAREKIANGYERGGLILAFDNPAPYEFTTLQKRKLQELNNAGVSKRLLMDALWGRGGSVSSPALNRALEDR